MNYKCLNFSNVSVKKQKKSKIKFSVNLFNPIYPKYYSKIYL